jgi:hypothetical protein
MTISVTYSHAAPYIRHLAAHAMSRALHSNTQKAQARGKAEADGLMLALAVLLRSPEGANEPGEVAEADTIPVDALKALFERYSGDHFGAMVLPIVPDEIKEPHVQ